MPSKTRGASKRRPADKLVRAWFDTALNPLLQGLDTETNVLADENWTWRFQPPRLLSLVPVRSYIVKDAWPNLDQFLDFHPDCRPAMDRHDQQVQALFESCGSFHGALTQSESLRQVYGQTTSAFASSTGAKIADLFGAYPQEHHLDVLAELIVNNTGKLPSYYATAPLWNQYRDEFLKTRESEDVRPHWESTRKIGRDLAGAVDALSSALSDLRKDLSSEYGEPIVLHVFFR